MVNKDFRDFMEKENNIDFNYQKIREKTTKKFNIKKLMNIAAVILIVALVGIGSSNIYAKRQWEIEFQEYQREWEMITSVSVKESTSDGYTENIDMDYVYQNNIGVKVDSIMITDNKLEANINFEFDENIEVDSTLFQYGLVIYDDNSKMYGCMIRDDKTAKLYGSQDYGYKYIEYVLKEIGNTDYNKRDGLDSAILSEFGSIGTISASKGNIISKVAMESQTGFPKSKKIYIRIFNLGFTMIDIEDYENYEDFRLSGNKEWIFEIEIPEKMYNR